MRKKFAPPPQAEPGDVLDKVPYSAITIGLWRRYLGVDRTELAHLSGVSWGMIRYGERGEFPMHGRLVNKIAHALDVPANLLILHSPSDEQAQAAAMRAAVRFARRRLEGAGHREGVA